MMEVLSGQTVGSDTFDAYVMLRIICAYNLCENEKIIGNFNRIDNKYSHFFLLKCVYYNSELIQFTIFSIHEILQEN